jgi:hypothetical protein
MLLLGKKSPFFMIPAALLVTVFLSGAAARGEEIEQISNPGTFIASLFKTYISPVDGDRCPSIPTCSSYSALVFKKHGFFMGWLMTVDRLIHEGSEEAAVSPCIAINGRVHLLDPPESNDFWWSADGPDR